MSRLLKKCLFLSIGLHVLLAAVLIFCTAFFVAKPDKILPTLSMIAPDVLDNLLKPQRVSTPKPNPQPPARRIVNPPPMRSQITPTPPPRPVKIKKTIPKPKPPRRKPTKNKAAPKPKRKVIQIAKNTQTSVSVPSRTAKNKPKVKAPTFNNSELEKIKARRGRHSAAINVKVPGANAAAFAAYSNFVVDVYRRTWEPLIPKGLARLRIAKVSVTINRDGRVLSARIIRETGDVGLDRSVQLALERVRTIGKSFPSGSKDSQRTFTLDFTPRIRGGR